jgi:hypothetical protein
LCGSDILRSGPILQAFPFTLSVGQPGFEQGDVSRAGAIFNSFPISFSLKQLRLSIHQVGFGDRYINRIGG